MKSSNENFERLLVDSKRARPKTNKNLNSEQYFKEPIIHRKIHGDRVYMPLNLDRVWNKV